MTLISKFFEWISGVKPKVFYVDSLFFLFPQKFWRLHQALKGIRDESSLKTTSVGVSQISVNYTSFTEMGKSLSVILYLDTWCERRGWMSIISLIYPFLHSVF